jgi:superfamily II DNA/RNA helicase
MHQTKRMAVYESFSRKQRSVLFATDIAARGLGNFIITIVATYWTHFGPGHLSLLIE